MPRERNRAGLDKLTKTSAEAGWLRGGIRIQGMTAGVVINGVNVRRGKLQKSEKFLPLQATTGYKVAVLARAPVTFRLRSSLKHRRCAFTLIELMVVVGVIAVLLATLTPALGPASGRSLDNSTRQFLGDAESARLMAIAERTRTRILIPAAPVPALGEEVALRGYIVASFNRTTSTWKQRGKLTRLPQSVAFDPDPTLTDPATQMSVLADRRTESTPLDNSITLTAPYVEFRANGGTSLDPNGKLEVVVLADAIADASGAFVAKNRNLRSQITIDPLSGGATSK